MMTAPKHTKIMIERNPMEELARILREKKSRANRRSPAGFMVSLATS